MMMPPVRSSGPDLYPNLWFYICSSESDFLSACALLYNFPPKHGSVCFNACCVNLKVGRLTQQLFFFFSYYPQMYLEFSWSAAYIITSVQYVLEASRSLFLKSLFLQIWTIIRISGVICIEVLKLTCCVETTCDREIWKTTRTESPRHPFLSDVRFSNCPSQSWPNSMYESRWDRSKTASFFTSRESEILPSRRTPSVEGRKALMRSSYRSCYLARHTRTGQVQQASFFNLSIRHRRCRDSPLVCTQARWGPKMMKRFLFTFSQVCHV